MRSLYNNSCFLKLIKGHIPVHGQAPLAHKHYDFQMDTTIFVCYCANKFYSILFYSILQDIFEYSMHEWSIPYMPITSYSFVCGSYLTFLP